MPRRHPIARPTMWPGGGELRHALAAELFLQPPRDAEHAALPFVTEHLVREASAMSWPMMMRGLRFISSRIAC